MNEDLKNDMKLTLAKAKAVAEAYAELNARSMPAITSPDRQCYLYAILEDLLCNACEMADKMN